MFECFEETSWFIINDDELLLVLDLNIDINNSKEYKFIKPINRIVSYYNSNQKWGLSFYKFKLNNYNYYNAKRIRRFFDI